MYLNFKVPGTLSIYAFKVRAFGSNASRVHKLLKSDFWNESILEWISLLWN